MNQPQQYTTSPRSSQHSHDVNLSNAQPTRKPWLKFRGKEYTDFKRVIIRNHVAERCGLKPSEHLVLLVIADHVQERVNHEQYRNAFPSQETLAMESGLSIRQVKTACKRLTEFGLIERIRLWKSWRYRIAHPDDLALFSGAEFARDNTEIAPDNTEIAPDKRSSHVGSLFKGAEKPRQAVQIYLQINRGLPGQWQDIFWEAVEALALADPVEIPTSKQEAMAWIAEQLDITDEELAVQL